jgi:hypothetical protein
MSKKNRRKNDPVPPEAGKTHKSRWMFWGVVILLLGGVLVGFYHTKITYRHINEAVLTSLPTGEKKQPVVARTAPEEGEVLSTTIIEKEGEATASSITVLTQPQPVVDVTPALQEPRPAAVAQEVEAARLAQATLHLSKVAQTQSFRLLALYTAFTAGAPEAMTLLAQAQAAAQDGAQAQALKNLADASRETGPLTRWDILMALPAQVGASEISAVEQEPPVAFSGVLGQALGQLVTVRKASPSDVVLEKTVPSWRILHKALRRGDTAAVQDLLQEEAFAGAPFNRVRELLAAYQQQRAALLQLLP